LAEPDKVYTIDVIALPSQTVWVEGPEVKVIDEGWFTVIVPLAVAAEQGGTWPTVVIV